MWGKIFFCKNGNPFHETVATSSVFKSGVKKIAHWLDYDNPSKCKIRPCDIYWDEYKECTKFRTRFHQYFIYGETLDCHQWRKDYDNCSKWTDKKDLKAAKTLVESERARRLERFRNHYKNDVWKKRDSPPLNWDAPLPEWLVERDKNSYLAARAQEIKEGKDFKEHASCSIM